MLGRTSWLRSTTFIVVLAASMGGCIAPRIDRAGRLRTGRAFCLRGLLDVFSLGLNDLSERLRGEGISAITVSGPSWPDLARRIRGARLRGELAGPLILVGHSYGADDAVRLARRLGRYSIDVALVVLLDATSPPPLPPNVARCVHVYRPTVLGDLFPILFAGNPVEAAEGNDRTEIVNKIVSRADFGAAAARVDHMNIDASTDIHGFVMKEVLRVCPMIAVREGSRETDSVGQPSGTSRVGD